MGGRCPALPAQIFVHCNVRAGARNDLTNQSYGNYEGTLAWNADWTDNDPQSVGARNGKV